MNLTEYIREKRKTKDILCMAHLVCGYPDFAANKEVIRIMVEMGVDLIELQIPFSEPTADGPMILKANQLSLQRGTRVRDCLSLMREVSSQYPIPFLFMTYYNILFSRGVDAFVQETRQAGGVGFIIPDIPPEEGEEYFNACHNNYISPILLMTPTTSPQRLSLIAEAGDGFFYCVARKGVTGAQTHLSQETDEFIRRCRKVTDLPLAMGLGISRREDLDYLRGKVDIAVIGSAILRTFEQGGYQALQSFLEKLS
ncbi:MAG: tryptophan synthase subunit alpha [bacterium]